MVGAVLLARVVLDAGTRCGMGDRVVPGVCGRISRASTRADRYGKFRGISCPLSPEKQIDLSFAP
jgi:hypothetical protein